MLSLMLSLILLTLPHLHSVSASHSTAKTSKMDNNALSDGKVPFMVRRKDTGECAVLLIHLSPSHLNLRILLRQIYTTFSTNRYWGDQKMISKLEVCWLSRQGYHSEGYPQRLLFNNQNMIAILRLMLLRQGIDVIEATFETPEEMRKRGS